MEGRNKMLKEEMEMRIAICDDEKIALEQTCNIVKDVFDEMHLKYFIDVYMDANELLQNKDQYDIVFLDIELKDSDKNGVWVAKMIKRYYPESIIIFTTNYEEYIDEVIEKYAFRYWSKPIDRYRLKKSIAPILEKMQTIKVEIYESKRKFELPLRNIMYITPENKHCKIVTISNEYVVSDSYKEIKEKFPTRNFCECHGSYCVNLNYDDNPTTYWAYPYMKKASELGFKTIDDQDIDVSINKLDKLITIGETKVSRGEAAKYICQLFFDQRKEVNVPTLLYDKVENIENERKNAYKNFIDVSGNKNENYIYKLYMNNILNGQDKNTMAPDADIRRSEICTILIKCLFDMDENIPVIIANIEENTEAVPVDVYMTTDERIIKNISFNNNNKAAFNIHIEDDEEYEVKIEGGTETTIQGEMDCIEGTGTFTPETTQKGDFVYTIHGPGVFQLNLVRSGIDIINLKISKVSHIQIIPFNQVVTQDKVNGKILSFTAEKNGCYIINVTPGTTFNLTDQAGRKVEEYYTELYRGFNSSVPEFITRKMRKANRELNYIDGNGNKTTQTEKCDCYKYHLEKGTVVTIDTIESTETYKLQVDEPQDGDIVFQQHENEGEYFIYSDAPEAITDNTLADYAPYAFIREEHLGKGKYTFMSWHLNYSSESAIMDVQLYSENAKIKVNAIGINAPQMDGWDEDWTSPQAILNMEYFKCEKLFKLEFTI